MTRIPANLPVIGPEARLYGYITGVGIAPNPDSHDDPVPQHLYAMFEYNGKSSVWVVPDHELFAQLARHLIDMAATRSEHCDARPPSLSLILFSLGLIVRCSLEVPKHPLAAESFAD
ncbi:MAG TPA: hypothetical protein VGL24_06000 [Chthoniobacterales bacterium]